MIVVDVKKLIEAIDDANSFCMPYMTQGSEYLYDNLYRRLTCGETVNLSELDFGSFELEDLDMIRELHTDVLEANENKSETLTRSLRELAPVTVAAAYV